jgi:hypothetical protein
MNSVVTSSGFVFEHAPHGVVITRCPRKLIYAAELEYLREVAALRYGWGSGKVLDVRTASSAGRTLHILDLRVKIAGAFEQQSITFDVAKAMWQGILSELISGLMMLIIVMASVMALGTLSFLIIKLTT